MIWQDYQLDDVVSKTMEATVLWQAEKGLVEISKGMLAVAIKLGDKERGYMFHGHGKLVLDTIVETEEGAVGKPTEKEIDNPFLMLGNLEEAKQHLSEASQEDIAKIGYENQQDFLVKSRDLLDRFFKRRGSHGFHYSSEDRGVIFAFQNENSKFDILVAKGSDIVYKSLGMVFVLNKDKVVLKSSDGITCMDSNGIACLNCGKLVILRK